MKWTAAALLAALLLLLPSFAGDFYINLASQILIAAIFALSLNLLVGYGGMTSLGHASYLGAAAYISALLTSRYGFGHGPAAVISIAGTTAMAAMPPRRIGNTSSISSPTSSSRWGSGI